LIKFNQKEFAKDLSDSLLNSGWWWHSTSKRYVVVLERFNNEGAEDLTVKDLLNVNLISPLLRKVKDVAITTDRIRITCMTASLQEMGYEYD
jgi:hypothetical protein